MTTTHRYQWRDDRGAALLASRAGDEAGVASASVARPTETLAHQRKRL